MNEKTQRLSIALLERDKIALKNLAQREGEAMAVIVRRLIREAGFEPSQATAVKGVSHDRQ
jgi:hypothetical protein